MHDRILHALSGVAKDERLLLAVSGGGDSFAMMKWFASQPQWKNRVVAAHVNHSIREDAIQVAELAKRQADSLKLSFAQSCVNVPHKIAQKNESLEACARRLRYESLERLRTEHNCSRIVTAHTLDDNAETVFMKLSQGSSWYECTGIPFKREKILRPFLTVARCELHSLLTSEDKYDHDPMNGEIRFPRVRHRARLAAAGEAGSAIVNRLSQHGNDLRKAEGLTQRLLNICNINILDKSMLPAFGLESLPKNLYLEDLDFLAVETIWARRICSPDARLPASTRRKITEFLHGGSRNVKLKLPYDVSLHKAGARVWLQQSLQQHAHGEASQAPTVVLTPDEYLGKQSGVLEISTDSWHVRGWRAGERFRPAKRRTRKISDWLSDAGVHPALRNQWPVVCDSDRIIAIPGLGVSEHALPAGNAPVIRIPWKARRHLDQ